MRMSRITWVLIFLCIAIGNASAQFPVSIGIKGGVALTDAFENNTFSYPNTLTGPIVIHNYSPSKDYVVGPFIEVRLPFGFGVEADGLYRPLHFATSSGIAAGENLVPASYLPGAHAWEFPILAKYRFKLPVARPYVDAGPSFRTINNGYLGQVSNHGFAAGAGVDIKALLLHVSPEIRYTRWGADNIPAGAIGPPYSNKNQVELLVGIGF
jgi:hypothetical protein